MARHEQLVEEYVRMWPRAVFDCLIPNEDGKGKKTKLVKGLDFLNKPGVYVLYRDEMPYYIGQAAPLRGRLWHHASYPGARYHNFWNFFCAFVVPDKRRRTQIEGILIASMPTANGAKPKIKKVKMPPSVVKMAANIRRAQANPQFLGPTRFPLGRVFISNLRAWKKNPACDRSKSLPSPSA